MFMICLCFAFTAVAQNAIPVDTLDAASYGVMNAKIETIWVPKVDENTNKEIKEKEARLVFSALRADLNVGVVLTAISNDGSTMGQSIWFAKAVRAGLVKMAEPTTRETKETVYSLVLDQNLLNAAKYRMSILPAGSDLEAGLGAEATCKECADLAKDVCGYRGPMSASCAAAGCSVTCN
ncbi:MAG: hypothetical protein KF756_01000 [Acidobacteria bacterium]|nr:hypothetical protein [Acidobacteriota bacterium]